MGVGHMAAGASSIYPRGGAGMGIEPSGRTGRSRRGTGCQATQARRHGQGAARGIGAAMPRRQQGSCQAMRDYKCELKHVVHRQNERQLCARKPDVYVLLAQQDVITSSTVGRRE